MKKSKTHFCFNVGNIHQALEIISICKSKKKVPIFFIKYHLINGFGLDWILEFRNLLLKKYKKKEFKFLIDCKNNFAFFLYLVQKKFEFLNIKADNKTLLRLQSIAKKNNVTINPKISVINLSNVKNFNQKYINIL